MKLDTFFIRIKRKLFWAPILGLIVGFYLSFILFKTFKNEELGVQRAIFTQAANEITDKADLLLSNSILRIQVYEEAIGFGTNKIKKNDITILEQVLKNTIFERMTIFQEVPDKKNPIRNYKLKILYRTTLKSSSLPKANSDYLQSEDLYSHLDKLKKISGYLEPVIYERDGKIRLSVAIKSKNQTGIYYIFTTPFSRLIESSEKNSLSSISLHSESSQEFNVELNKNLSSKALGKFAISITRGFENSNLPVKLNYIFYYQPTFEFKSSIVIGLLGVFLSCVISYLFSILISHTRRANRELLAKTLDLEKTATELQEASAARTKFFGKVSHEIRTPLNLILGMIDVCLESDTEKRITPYLNSMRNSSEHLLYMIDDLVELAKNDTSNMQLEQKQINLCNFTTDISKMVGLDCKKNNLAFNVRLDPTLPKQILSDPHRLRQILLNLLRNAVKYTEKGHITFSVDLIKINDDHAKICFRVEDTGKGIPQDKLHSIFDAFFQIDSHKNLYDGGVGLGLSIVKDLVNKLGGSIKVTSKPNTGSKFEVFLDFKIESSESWLTSFKNNKIDKCECLVLLDDNSLLNTLEILNSHPQILLQKNIPAEDLEKNPSAIIITDNFETLENSKFQKNPIIYISEHKNIKPKHEKIIQIGLNPLLLSELLPALGFSSRAKERVRHEPKTEIVTSTDDITNHELNILVAEDDRGNIELYKAYFQGCKWHVTFEQDGQLAFEAYSKAQADVAIFDLRMPNMDGFELISAIRKYEERNNLKNIPIILVTADLIQEVSNVVAEYKNIQVLNKPIRKTTLFKAIDNSLKATTTLSNK